MQEKKEEWRTVAGFEDYEVSNTGKIRSLKTDKANGGRVLKPFINRGYAIIHFSKNGKHYNGKVHRIVAQAFIPNPENKPEVNHLDENKLNNNVWNLEWVTPKENLYYGTRLERCAKNAPRKRVLQKDLDGNLIKEWESSLQIQRELGFFAGNIRSACNGKAKTAYGFRWEHSIKEEMREDIDEW